MHPEFGTSGLRGPADALTDELVGRYTAAFISLFPNDGTIWIGQDRRESSPRIAKAVASAAAASGLVVIDAGVLPTPALALTAMGRGTISIMVTGSHIPADRNGLKFYRADGEIDKSDEMRLKEAVAHLTAPAGGALATAKGDAAQAYIDRYRGFFGKRALKGTRVGVWQHSSAASEVLPALLDGLGAEAVPLEPSQSFVPVDTEAVDPAILGAFPEWTQTHMLDAVVSTDGDADRPLLADGSGRLVPGDLLGAVAAHALGATHVVTTVSANTAVDRMGVFEQVVRTRIGSPFVIEAMAALSGKKVIGYEPNGGLLLGFDLEAGTRHLSKLMTRDCALPIIMTLMAGAKVGGISKLIEGLPRRRTATGRLQNVPTEVSKRIVADLLDGDYSVFPEGLGEPVSVDTTDGARFTFEGDIILTVRPSGNAPEIRAYVEVANAKAANQFLDTILTKLKDKTAQG